MDKLKLGLCINSYQQKVSFDWDIATLLFRALLIHCVWHRLWHQVWHCVWHCVWHQVWHCVWHQAWHRLWHQVWHRLCYRLWHRLWHRVWHYTCDTKCDIRHGHNVTLTWQQMWQFTHDYILHFHEIICGKNIFGNLKVTFFIFTRKFRFVNCCHSISSKIFR